MKIKIGAEGLLASLLNSITHLIIPWLSGYFMTYSIFANDPNAILLGIIGTFILLPISIFDIQFEDEKESEAQ